MKKIDKDRKLFYEQITIIYDKSFIEVIGHKLHCCPEDKCYSFNELVEKYNLPIKNRVIKILCENPLDGIVLCYGNYRDNELYQIGELKGYA